MTQTAKRLHTQVGLPKTLLAAIGHVAAFWGQLEYTIDRKISEALALPGAPKINPKLMIPFNQRLELLDKLCKQFLTDQHNRKLADEIIRDLKHLSGMPLQKLRRVTSVSGPRVTSLSGVYISDSHKTYYGIFLGDVTLDKPIHLI